MQESNRWANLKTLLRGRTLSSLARKSMDWLRDKINGVRDTRRNVVAAPDGLPQNKAALMAMKQRLHHKTAIGRMYFFVYDPKHKMTLPYYDKFPLIFPIEAYDNGFLGINLHYLDIRNRALLLGKLLELTNNKRYDHTTRLKISYQILKGMGNLHKPCIKRYLSDHVRSQFIQIEPDEWENALWLPFERFEKAPMSKVWRDSRKKIR